MDMLLSTGEQVSIALVSMAIQSQGYSAISFTGAQAGIITDGIYSKARILKINSQKVLNCLKEGKIVIIAGFQGINEEQEITTLGRGGSDTSAVVIAAALKAKRCEIYTDVDGVYTADPRIVKDAKKLEEITYDEMLELASLGAKVLHPRAVEVAKEYRVPLYVLSSFKKVRGTAVKEKLEKERKVSGVTCDKNVAKISILSVPDKPGIAAKLFEEIAKEKINVDMIIQNITRGKVNDISFTVSKDEAKKALKISEKVCRELKAEKVLYDETLAKVSIVGAGMVSSYGVAAKMFKALGDNNINIEMISTSEIKISCLISAKYADKAVKILHKEFNLSK
jgi:aspartate kinase